MKKNTKSLLISTAEVMMGPIDVNQGELARVLKYSYKNLQQIAYGMGIDTHLSKVNLAKCIIVGKNVIFPEEIGVYSLNTLKKIAKYFGIQIRNPSRNDIKKVVLEIYNSKDDVVNANLTELLKLYKIVQNAEKQYCTTRIKSILKSKMDNDKPSLYEYMQNKMKDITQAFTKWQHSDDIRQRRHLVLDIIKKRNKAEATLNKYMAIIEQYCKGVSKGNCSEGNIPYQLKVWLENAPLMEKIGVCNITLYGQKLNFKIGDELVRGYKIFKIYLGSDRQTKWFGVGKTNKKQISNKSDTDIKKNTMKKDDTTQEDVNIEAKQLNLLTPKKVLATVVSLLAISGGVYLNSSATTEVAQPQDLAHSTSAVNISVQEPFISSSTLFRQPLYSSYSQPLYSSYGQPNIVSEWTTEPELKTNYTQPISLQPQSSLLDDIPTLSIHEETNSSLYGEMGSNTTMSITEDNYNIRKTLEDSHSDTYDDICSLIPTNITKSTISVIENQKRKFKTVWLQKNKHISLRTNKNINLEGVFNELFTPFDYFYSSSKHRFLSTDNTKTMLWPSTFLDTTYSYFWKLENSFDSIVYTRQKNENGGVFFTITEKREYYLLDERNKPIQISRRDYQRRTSHIVNQFISELIHASKKRYVVEEIRQQFSEEFMNEFPLKVIKTYMDNIKHGYVQNKLLEQLSTSRNSETIPILPFLKIDVHNINEIDVFNSRMRLEYAKESNLKNKFLELYKNTIRHRNTAILYTSVEELLSTFKLFFEEEFYQHWWGMFTGLFQSISSTPSLLQIAPPDIPHEQKQREDVVHQVWVDQQKEYPNEENGLYETPFQKRGYSVEQPRRFEA